MAPINEKTPVDQETGYSSLSEATPLKEHKSSWRRSGVAAAVLSALALGVVAAINTSSPKRASKTTELEDYPLVSISNTVDHKVSGTVSYGGRATIFFCKPDYYSIAPKATWTASSRGLCLVTKITATVEAPYGKVYATPYKSSGTGYSQFAVIGHDLSDDPNQLLFEVTRR